MQHKYDHKEKNFMYSLNLYLTVYHSYEQGCGTGTGNNNLKNCSAGSFILKVKILKSIAR